MPELKPDTFRPGRNSDPTTAYFNLQAYWGITEHMGGLAATRRLADLCQIRKGSHVLDIGCGVGITPCFVARNRHCHVTAIDYNAGMIANAKGRVLRERLDDRVRLAVTKARDLPFADETFDTVIVESVTSFIADRKPALAEFARVTKPGGFVGLNELTWLEDAHPELARYLDRAMGAAPLPPEQWLSLLAGTGLEPAEPHVDRLRYLDQIKNELVRHSALEMAMTWTRFITLYLRNPEFRKYVGKLAGAPSGFFRYLGYGLYVGHKR